MTCKACGSDQLHNLLFRENVPIFQNMKYKNKIDALNATCDNLDIKICDICGMAHNVAFKSEIVDYCDSYENSQFYSPIYTNYVDEIINLLINKYNINNTNIVEIGCGNGKFLSTLAQRSNSNGFGFDPAFNENDNMGGGRNKKRILQLAESTKSRDYYM